jgi:hypothetical protein
MTDLKASRSLNIPPLKQPLDFAHRYPCPVCRHGHLEGLFLVDAFSCGFCRHIFTVDSQRQNLCLEDTAQPLRWRWTGDRWISAQSGIAEDSLFLLWGLGLSLVMVPTAIVWLANYTFPPLLNEGGPSFALLWTGLTFLSHASIVVWYCLEYYQIPLYLILKFYIQRLFQPLLSS